MNFKNIAKNIKNKGIVNMKKINHDWNLAVSLVQETKSTTITSQKYTAITGKYLRPSSLSRHLKENNIKVDLIRITKKETKEDRVTDRMTKHVYEICETLGRTRPSLDAREEITRILKMDKMDDKETVIKEIVYIVGAEKVVKEAQIQRLHQLL